VGGDHMWVQVSMGVHRVQHGGHEVQVRSPPSWHFIESYNLIYVLCLACDMHANNCPRSNARVSC
jgi:hypothetical protein